MDHLSKHEKKHNISFLASFRELKQFITLLDLYEIRINGTCCNAN